MSSTFEKARLALAVIVAAALLLWSGFTLESWTPYVAKPIQEQDHADVDAGVAILRTARSPILGAQFCDAIKGLVPNIISGPDGDTRMNVPTAKPVIVCFKGGFDYGDALAAARARKLDWQRGLGGEKVMVFAPDAATFATFARANHMVVEPGDLHRTSPLLGRLAGQSRSHHEGRGWTIDPGPSGEVLFGPYADLQPGAYRLELVFEPAAGVSCQALTQSLRAAIAVTAQVRSQILASKQELALKPVDKTECRLGAQMPFTVPPGGAQKLETPIWEASDVPVKLTEYILEPVG